MPLVSVKSTFSLLFWHKSLIPNFKCYCYEGLCMSQHTGSHKNSLNLLCEKYLNESHWPMRQIRLHSSSQFGASANVTHSNIFHQESLNCFCVSLYVETYKDLHNNNIWNLGLEFSVKIIRKTLISLKPKTPFPWTWHFKDRFNSNSCKNGRGIFCID